MASPERFQRLASKLINKTFGKFRGDIIFTKLGDYTYSSQGGIDIETNAKGIRTEYTKSEIDGESIQQGDYKILLVQQETAVDVRSDNVTMQFKPYPTTQSPNPVFKSVSIESVNEDAAAAVYVLQVREL